MTGRTTVVTTFFNELSPSYGVGNDMEESPTELYRRKTGRSRELLEECADHLPGGDTRAVTYFEPYPSFVRGGSGCRLETVDGEILIDFLNNYTQSVLGHAPEGVVEASCEAIRSGNGLGAPNERILELAERLTERIPSADLARFTNSGTEATMNAVHAAIGWTGNDRICKVNGGYHGSYDMVQVDVTKPGRAHPGIPGHVDAAVDSVRYNDVDGLQEYFAANGDDLACFILEPILGVGGMIPATNEFLQAARELTEETDTMFVFDEVMTYRLSPGGMQERRGVTPDLTTLGKLVGGGLPFGAIAGREDIMRQFHPVDGTITHSGTFNGNPATMAGGAATLDQFDRRTIERLNANGETLRTELQSIADEAGAPVTVTGEGSLFNLHLTRDEVQCAEDTVDDPRLQDIFMAMRAQGIHMAPRGMGNLSTPMGEAELDAFAGAFENAIDHVF